MSESKNGVIRIVYLEDGEADRELVWERLMADEIHCELRCAMSEAQFRAAMDEGEFDIILSDFELPMFGGMEALAIAKKAHPDVPFIFVSGTIGDERAVATLKSGATDYVLKSHLERLAGVLMRAVREAQQITKRKRAEQRLLESE